VTPGGAVYSRYPAGARVSLPRIAGHRDADTTECPGNDFYGELPRLRPLVSRLAGRVASASLAQGPAAATGSSAQEQGSDAGSAPGTGSAPAAGSPPTAGSAPGIESAPAAGSLPPGTQPWTLTGIVTFLDGSPIVGAPVTLQARSVSDRGEVVRELTVAETRTGAEGRWSQAFALSPDRAGTWLRALCPGASGVPVVVSKPVHVAGTVSALPAS
jgi:hypothetical protein